MTRTALTVLMVLAVGVAGVPTVPGAVAVAAVALVVAVFRRQDSRDTEVQHLVVDRENLDKLEEAHAGLQKAHDELRAEFDRVKLMVPRPKG